METENQSRLRRAKEALAYARERESELRKSLNDAVHATRLAKERHDELFLAEERAEAERLKANYLHATN